MNQEAESPAPNYRAPIISFVLSMPVQAISFALATVFSQAIANLILLVLFQAIVAYSLASWLRLSPVWRIFNASLWPLLLVSFNLNVPSEFITVVLILGLLIYVPTFWTKVPYYPTSDKTYQILLEQLPSDKEFTFIDLGCGFGRLLQYLAKHRPLGKFYGTEISPLAFTLAWLRAKVTRQGRVIIEPKDFWTINLSDYEVVYAFLAPPPMAQLWDKVKAEMRPGTVFISNSFEVPAKADRIIEIEDNRKCRLLLYKI